jgi:hypothetical protein
MESGVCGENGVHASGRVIVAPWHDLDRVAIQLLHMAVLIAKETSMTRRNVIYKHVQVFIL